VSTDFHIDPESSGPTLPTEPVDLAVVIPTLNAAGSLADTLRSIQQDDRIRAHVVIVDGGSTDATLDVAEQNGVPVENIYGFDGEPSRGGQIADGLSVVRDWAWVMILHADTVLSPRWVDEVLAFTHLEGAKQTAAYFQFQLKSTSRWARMVERGARLRTRIFGVVTGDQGLVISQIMLARIGGMRRIPIMEDVDLIQRIGKRNLVPLNANARTSAARYEKSGYLPRVVINFYCLILFYLKFPPEFIKRQYG